MALSRNRNGCWWMVLYVIKQYHLDLVMGCCNSGELEIARDSFEQAWQVFRATDLAKPDRFTQNKQRVFRYLYLSIVLPQTRQTRDRVFAFAQKLPKNSGALGEVRREIVRLDEELVNLEEKRRMMHQDFLKRIKSDMLSHDEPSKFPLRNQGEEKQAQPEGYSQPVIAESVPSARQSVSEMHQSHIRSSYDAYSVPLTAMDSMIAPRLVDEQLKADSSQSPNERLMEALEFESDRRKALEIQVQALDGQLEQQRALLAGLEGTRAALLDELRGKQDAIQQLRQEKMVKRLQEEAIQMRRDKEELQERVQEMQLQLKQFRGEVARLDRERDEALRQNKYLNGKVKELGDTLCHTTNEDSVNVSLSFLPQLAPHRKPTLGLTCVIEQRVEPSSKISEQNKLDRSFIMVEDEAEEGAAEQLNGYSILFNLFSHSRVLPSHADFQAAVGTRTIITDLFDRRPLRSELLFAFDPITPNHFARYIEGRGNLLLLVALPNGLTLGGFAGNLVGDNELSDSFLFSLDPHREPMKLTPAPSRRVRRIDLDPGQLVFGNGELKVRAKTLEISCSVGCFQSLYWWGKRAVPVEKFLGTSERTLMANAYEIHQLHFA